MVGHPSPKQDSGVDVALGAHPSSEAAVTFLVRRYELSLSARQVLLLLMVAASVGGILLNVSFHLANSNAHPWLIPESGFDEGVDFHSFMPLVQLAIAVTWTKLYLLFRRARRNAAG